MLGEILRSLHTKCHCRNKGTRIGMRLVPKDFEVGRGCIIGKKTHVSNNVKIGDFSYINSNAMDTFIESNTRIGSFCSIAPGVIIGMGNHYPELCTTHPMLFNEYYAKLLGWDDTEIKKNGLKDQELSTQIGSDVWIGARANIKRGVKIGNGAIVAAEAVVTHDVPDYAIVAGVPARVVGFRFDTESVDFLKKNEAYCFWNWELEDVRSNLGYLYHLQDYKNVILKIQRGGNYEEDSVGNNCDV